VRAVIVGLIAGGLALLFQWGLYYAELGRGWLRTQAHQQHLPGWLLLPLITAALCGIAGWLTALAPEVAGSGIPHVKAVLLRLRVLRWRRVVPLKFFGGLLAIGGGLSLGREGPTVQLGAAVGQSLAGLLRVPRRSQLHLVACGAGAGLAAAFNAPLAGFIFVLEELRRELSPITYGTALIAAVSADLVTRGMLGQLPSFHVTGYPGFPLRAFPAVAVLGIAAGIGGVMFNRGLMLSLGLFSRLSRVPRWARVAAVGGLAGLLLWWLPEAVGGGHSTAERVLRGEFDGPGVLQFLVVLLLAKFALTMLSYGSGAPGGIFAPLLVIGALLGLLIGRGTTALVPSLPIAPAAFAVIGMGAYFAAVVRAPLTGIVLIIEMTANYDQMFALAVACLIAYVVAESLGDTPIYDALLRRDLDRASPDELTGHEPALFHFVVEPGAPLDGRALRDAGLPPRCLLVSLRRAGREVLPDGATRLQSGDEVVAAVAGDVPRTILKLETCLRTPRGE
jgi:chloride channel protein, CIC family